MFDFDELDDDQGKTNGNYALVASPGELVPQTTEGAHTVLNTASINLEPTVPATGECPDGFHEHSEPLSDHEKTGCSHVASSGYLIRDTVNLDATQPESAHQLWEDSCDQSPPEQNASGNNDTVTQAPDICKKPCVVDNCDADLVKAANHSDDIPCSHEPDVCSRDALDMCPEMGQEERPAVHEGEPCVCGPSVARKVGDTSETTDADSLNVQQSEQCSGDFSWQSVSKRHDMKNCITPDTGASPETVVDSSETGVVDSNVEHCEIDPNSAPPVEGPEYHESSKNSQGINAPVATDVATIADHRRNVTEAETLPMVKQQAAPTSSFEAPRTDDDDLENNVGECRPLLAPSKEPRNRWCSSLSFCTFQLCPRRS